MTSFEVTMQGYSAYVSHASFTSCPYKEGSVNWLLWTGGWLKAEQLKSGE